MPPRRGSPFAMFAILLGCASLAGCEGCAAERHVEAQALDGGVRVPEPPVFAGPASCFVEAQRRTRLLDDQAFLLCQGAPSAGPVACYAAARRDLGFTDAQRITLCRCANGAGPAACVQLLERETWLTDAQILELCSPTISGSLLSNCRPSGGWY